VNAPPADGTSTRTEGGSAGVQVCLDALLAERGMTLTELSDRVGVTVVNLSILKNGHARAIRFSTLASLCQALGCQPGELLRFQSDQPAGQPAAQVSPRGIRTPDTA
jgi:putative transcriptional regulator